LYPNWAIANLTTPVPIMFDVDRDYVISIVVDLPATPEGDNGTFALLSDAGPALAPGFSDLYSDSLDATTGMPVYQNIGLNNIIAAFVDMDRSNGARTSDPIVISSQGRQKYVDWFNANSASMETTDASYIPSLQRMNTTNNSRSLNAYRIVKDGVSLDTVSFEQEHYVDMGLSFGVDYTYYVTALYDTSESSASNTITVNLTNTPPSDFTMLSPTDHEVISINRENIATGVVSFSWMPSTDADGDAVEYTFAWVRPNFWTESDDSVTSNTTLDLSFQYIYDHVASQQDTVSWWWMVDASDGMDTTAATSLAGMTWMTVNFDISAMLSIDGSAIPEVFALHQNYPNPFNPVTSIQFDIPEQSEVRMDIYNLMGQRVATLVNNTLEPGFHAVKWNGTNDFGKQLSSGMYIYRISANNFTSVKKLILMK